MGGPINEHYDTRQLRPEALMNSLRQMLSADRWLAHRRVILAVIWITLFILTHIPVPRSVQGLGVSDKLIHLVGYFPLGLLLPLCRVPGCQSMIRCLIAISGYGVLDELLQMLVGRTASFLDWFADVFGVLLGLAVAWILIKNTSEKREATRVDGTGV